MLKSGRNGNFEYSRSERRALSAKLMITGMFTPIVGIFGTLLGFDFGSPND